MKYIKKLNIDFDNWEEYDENKKLKKIEKIYKELLIIFKDDELDYSDILEMVDDLVYDYVITYYDFKEIMRRYKNDKYIKQYIDLFIDYIENKYLYNNDDIYYKRLKKIKKNNIPGSPNGVIN